MRIFNEQKALCQTKKHLTIWNTENNRYLENFEH